MRDFDMNEMNKMLNINQYEVKTENLERIE